MNRETLPGERAPDPVETSSSPTPPSRGPAEPPLVARMSHRERLASLPVQLAAAQCEFQKTGGTHASGLFDVGGELLALREDVGRHNALDKLIGWALAANRIPLGEQLLCVSGRVSYELVQKAIAAGIPLIAAVGAPSSLAVELCERFGVTLVGFLRAERFNVYAHPERVIDGA